MSKTALIVDDSPLARHVLGTLLAEHELTADTAPSAEAALDYLKQRRPDVIFMDHMMPGMDGFEALEAIKANPATATIPVMMYTSQEGALYVGQARALGAFGVLPKELKPIEVERVLQALHLIPGEADGGRAGSPARPPPTESENHRVKELLEELFYQQRSALRDEIREGYQRALATTHTQLPPIAPLSAPQRARIGAAAAIALGAIALTFAYLYYDTHRLLRQTTATSSQLIASTAELNAASAQVLDSQSQQPLPIAPNEGFIEIIEWAVNLAGGYGFDEIPLDDARAQTISRLVQYLDRAGFSGSVAIDVHVGRFCMNFAADDGAPVLAPAEQLAAQCDQLGWAPAEAVAIGRRQTLGFANTVSTATADTGIRVQTASHGSDRPTIEYPLMNVYLTAGQWNETAASNHRIDLRLFPDADSAMSRLTTAR